MRMKRVSQGMVMAAVLLVLLPRPAAAQLTVLGDGALAAVTGQGFSSFTMADGVAAIDLNLTAGTYANIDSLKLGYWDKGMGNGPGWDQNWTGVQLGSPSSDLTFNGFYVTAVFDPATLNDPANRQLQSVTLGSKDVTGTLTADFQSLSALHASMPDDDRVSVGTQTYQFNHTELSVTIDLAGAHQGVWFNFGDAAPQ